MEDDFLFTDAEQAIVDQLVGAIYYPTDQPLSPALTAAGKQPVSSQEKIFSSVENSVSFQQRQRREYILGAALGGQPFAGKDDRLAVLELANALDATAPPLLDQFLNQPTSLNLETIKSNAELVGQLRVYQQVNDQLTAVESYFQLAYNVTPFFDAMNQFTDAELGEIIAQAKTFIAQVNEQGLDALLSDIPLPEPLDALLQKANLGLFFVKTLSTGERLRGLTVLIGIAAGISENRANPSPLPREQLMATIADLLSRTNVAVIFPLQSS